MSARTSGVLFALAWFIAIPAARGQTDCDGDGVTDEADLCPCVISPGGVDPAGRPLGDFDTDCDVDLADYAVFGDNYVNGVDCLNGDANKDGAIDPLRFGLIGGTR